MNNKDTIKVTYNWNDINSGDYILYMGNIEKILTISSSVIPDNVDIQSYIFKYYVNPINYSTYIHSAVPIYILVKDIVKLLYE